jgi:hypothetical protein
MLSSSCDSDRHTKALRHAIIGVISTDTSSCHHPSFAPIKTTGIILMHARNAAFNTTCMHDDRSMVDGIIDLSIEIYGPQTKILEGRTNRPERVFEALFKGVSTLFGLRIVEKCFETAFRTVGSAFQNLRLGGVKSQDDDSMTTH